MQTHDSRPITELAPGEVFVFGSNPAGAHAAGAARFALDHFGAVWGVGHGMQGSAYAVDSMSGLEVLAAEVQRLLKFAGAHPEQRFLVTEIGCGIAGYEPGEVAPMFRGSPENVVLPERFAALLAGETSGKDCPR